jgi:predicted unusual protein kinase regulating ubiquinone biosynthesis (AarF/ABC1/UbiB family)
VQHKWIKERCAGDIRYTVFASKMAKKLFPSFQYGWIAEEMEQKLPKEIDFTLEAKNAEKCRSNFKKYTQVVVPEIFIARPRLLVMSFERGISVSHVKEMAA